MDTVDPTLRLPVTCPICGTESLTEFPVLVVLVALTRWNQLKLHASCHEQAWDASPQEVKQLKAFVGEAWFQANQGLLSPPPPAARPLATLEQRRPRRKPRHARGTGFA